MLAILDNAFNTSPVSILCLLMASLLSSFIEMPNEAASKAMPIPPGIFFFPITSMYLKT
jgi:hypothetical protein